MSINFPISSLDFPDERTLFPALSDPFLHLSKAHPQNQNIVAGVKATGLCLQSKGTASLYGQPTDFIGSGFDFSVFRE
jgi:hypothetical protein